MLENYNSFRCTVCNTTFGELKNGCCPNCGTEDNYIVQNEIEDEDIDNELNID